MILCYEMRGRMHPTLCTYVKRKETTYICGDSNE